MNKILLGISVSALLLGGCILTPIINKTAELVPEETIEAMKTDGEKQIDITIKDGISWVDRKVTSATGGGITGAGILYLLSLYFRRNKKGNA